MNKTRISLLFIIFFSLLIITSPSFARPDHTKIICANCHRSLVEAEDDGGAICDFCHNIKDNLQRLERGHSQICKNCHNPPETPEVYHQMHSRVSCEKCHGNGTLPTVPNVGITNCDGCHGESVSFNGGGNIHDAHKAKLESACPKCHGAPPASRPSMSTPRISAATQEPINEIITQVYAKVINYRKYTLYEIFKKLSSTF